MNIKSVIFKLKRLIKCIISRIDKRLLSFNSQDILSALKECSINTGSTIFVHCSFDKFVGYKGNPSDLINTLQEIVGPNGTIMMPTMPFIGTALDFATKNPIVDIRRVPSRMGLLTEIFRRSKGVVRSSHPTHPIAAWGADSVMLVADHHLAQTPCGRQSPLHKLLDRNGFILLLGTGIEVLTFYHTVEELLEPILPVNPFTSEHYDLYVLDSHGEKRVCHTRLFSPTVSRLRNLNPLEAELKAMKSWQQRRIGSLKFIVLKTKDIMRASERLHERGIYCYDK